jgi:hypothetical protein
VTGQGLLDRMELLNQELQLQSGEADVTRGLLALNVAQDYFETYAAKYPNVVGSSTGDITTTASQEYSAVPTGLLRLDKLQYIENSLPKYDLTDVKKVGSHRGSTRWPLFSSPSTAGKPTAYYTNGTNIYWNVLPDASYTIRYYGFGPAADITAVGTFAYRDIVSFPIAAFAVKLMKIGIDDDPTSLDSLAAGAFTGVLTTLAAFDRDGAVGLEYTQTHIS